MAQTKDYYRLLEVEPFADDMTVKSAYRRLAKKYHPDVDPGNRSAEERFKEINEAYEVLGTPSKKRQYDEGLRFARQRRQGAYQQQGHEKPNDKAGDRSAKGKPETAKSQQRPQQARGSAQDRARSPEGKDSVHTPPPQPKGEAAETDTPITEMFDHFLKQGFGGKKGSHPSESTRPKGQGGQAKARRGDDITVEASVTPLEAEQGTVKTVNVEHHEFCRNCSGTGSLNGRMCTVCHGEKMTSRTKKIDVRIPGGVREGSRVRVAAEGGRGFAGGEDGDLFLVIKISVDGSLRVEGLDVYCDFPISVTEAVLGAQVAVPTLSGPVQMTIPPGTSSGKVLRLKDQGVKSGQSRGDQYVTVSVQVPEKLSPRERELLEELNRSPNFKPKR